MRSPNVKRRFKFGNKPTVLDGIAFHSRKEARRYVALKLLERAGEIANLRCQVKYELDVNGVRIATYTADFVYDKRHISGGDVWWTSVVEDVKGYPNDRWPMKKKLMKAIHGVEILET